MVDKGREVKNPHLSDIPGPHPRVGVCEEGMFWIGATTVVTKPNVVPTTDGLLGK